MKPEFICKNCKWWGVEYESVCDFPDTIHSDPKIDGMEVRASANDDQGLQARLVTGKYFGCMKFQGKHP